MMKHLRLMTWLLAPLSMIVLGYLFLLPPEAAQPLDPGVIGVIILDPLDLTIIENHPELAPVLSKLRHDGLSGTIAANGAVSMDDAIQEILTGNNPRKLRHANRPFDRNTYTIRTESPWDGMDADLLQILNRYRHRVLLIREPDQAGDDFTIEAVLSGIDSQEDRPEVIFVYLPRVGLSDSDYLANVGSHLASMTSAVKTWMVISPMHRHPVTWRFHVNQWLQQQDFLAVDQSLSVAGGSASNQRIAFDLSRAFFAGAYEPGVRINRQLTYSSGVVSREEYEGVRKNLASALRTVIIPETGENDTEKPLFSKIYKGEQFYTDRSEGSFPDLVWDVGDDAVVIVADMLPDATSDPWQRVSEPIETDVPGGWMCLEGAPFDPRIRDQELPKGLMAADIAPTILFLLSHPVARDMQGRVLLPLMTETLQLRVPSFVDSYSFHDPLVEQEF